MTESDSEWDEDDGFEPQLSAPSTSKKSSTANLNPFHVEFGKSTSPKKLVEDFKITVKIPTERIILREDNASVSRKLTEMKINSTFTTSSVKKIVNNPISEKNLNQAQSDNKVVQLTVANQLTKENLKPKFRIGDSNELSLPQKKENCLNDMKKKEHDDVTDDDNDYEEWDEESSDEFESPVETLLSPIGTHAVFNPLLTNQITNSVPTIKNNATSEHSSNSNTENLPSFSKKLIISHSSNQEYSSPAETPLSPIGAHALFNPFITDQIKNAVSKLKNSSTSLHRSQSIPESVPNCSKEFTADSFSYGRSSSQKCLENSISSVVTQLTEKQSFKDMNDFVGEDIYSNVVGEDIYSDVYSDDCEWEDDFSPPQSYSVTPSCPLSPQEECFNPFKAELEMKLAKFINPNTPLPRPRSQPDSRKSLENKLSLSSIDMNQEMYKNYNAKAKNIINELIKTESDYISSLQNGIVNYLELLDNVDLPLFMREHKDDMFSEIENIYNFHHLQFYPALEACNLNIKGVAETFQRVSDHCFHIYVLFAMNKNRSNKMCERFKVIFNKRAEELGDRLGVSSFLMHPIQRLTKYRLLLDEIIKTIMNFEGVKSEIHDQLLALYGKVGKSMEFVIESVNGAVSFGDIVFDQNQEMINISYLGRFLKHGLFIIKQKPQHKRYKGKVFLFQRSLIYTECDPNDDQKLYFRGIYRDITMGLWRDERSSKRKFMLFEERIGFKETWFKKIGGIGTADDWYKNIERILVEIIQRIKRSISQESRT